MKIKNKIIFALVVIGMIFLYREGYLNGEMLGWKAKDTISGYSTADIVVEESDSDIELYFCPADDCDSELYDILSTAEESLYCAFFDLNLPEIIALLEEKSEDVDVRLVVDDGNYDDVMEYSFAKQDTTSQYTHNKFCIVDSSIVTTGSMNPTENGAYKNLNNLIILESPQLASNYEEEFNELWNSEFGKGKRTKNPIVLLNNITVKSYFCPEDWCANKIIDELSLANSTVHFLAFSFTSEPISRKLIELHEKNITVFGVMEKQQNSQYSKYETMREAGLDVEWDNQKYKMHHKVFIVDSKIVITGSMNPTKSGDTRNDENVLIIYDEELAKRFIEEFETLR